MIKGSRKPQCVRGHKRTQRNTYILPSGHIACRKCLAENHAKCRAVPENWEKEKARIRQYNRKNKVETLTHYGPRGQLRCCWKRCLVTDVDMLSLDHVNNNGAEHRKELGINNSGVQIYGVVKRAGFPEGFQTLCCNHQMKKELLRRRAQYEHR